MYDLQSTTLSVQEWYRVSNHEISMFDEPEPPARRYSATMHKEVNPQKTECAMLTSMCSVTTLYHWLLMIDKSSIVVQSYSFITSYPVSRNIDPKALTNNIINNLSQKPLPCFLPMCRSSWGVWIMEEGSPSTGELSVWLRGGETAGGGHDWPRLTHHHCGNQRRKLNKDRLLPSWWRLTHVVY